MRVHRLVRSGFPPAIPPPNRRLVRYVLGAALRWNAWWLKRGGPSRLGRLMTRLALLWPLPFDQYRERHGIADLAPQGFWSPYTRYEFDACATGDHVYIAAHAQLHQDATGGSIELGDRVIVEEGCWLCTKQGAAIRIGRGTYLGGKTSISASVADIQIGSGVLIAGSCGVYSYDHGTETDRPMGAQQLVSDGPVVIGDDVWIGRGASILSGVTIGTGCIIGAGAVVTHDIPPFSIAGGVPARVVGVRPPSAAATAAAGLWRRMSVPSP
jgi:acetyltransferase-like isoleucine patch superfamily enzyme